MDDFRYFWESERYKNACLSKLDLPPETTQTLLDWVTKDKHILFFAGNPGVGKSYFCAAFIHRLKEKRKPFRYFTEYGFFRQMRETISKGWDYEYDINRLCETHTLIIDDIGTARGENLSDFQKEALHIMLDTRYNSKLPTLITSNIFLKDMKETVSEKFASRLRSSENTIVELNWIDKRQNE
jgi:DNA replication protein DnaC